MGLTMKWTKCIGVSALTMFMACSNDSKDVAAGSLETENSIAFHVKLADGGVAAKAKVIINTSDYLVSDANAPEQDELFTDKDGILKLDSLHTLPEGNYVVEVRSSLDNTEQKGVATFDVPKNIPDSGIVVPVTTSLPHSLSGTVQTNKFPVWINIRGLDYAVQVDSDGSYEFESLPDGEFEFVLLSTNEENDKPTILGAANVCVGCDKKPETIVDTTYTEVIIPDEDSSETLVHFVFDDFENGVDAWYPSHSPYATALLESAEAGEGREGLAAHFMCENDSAFNWALMGQYLGGTVDMSELDSIVFWARGSVENYISFSFDIVKEDSAANITSVKSWTHIELSDQWTRYSFTPADMIEADNDNGGNVGWDAVKDSVTNISIFGGAGGEFWIDDIEVFGYEKFTPKE